MKTFELTPRQTGNIRLMELAQILDRTEYYCQRNFRMANCESPACALGYWAHHHRDRWAFTAEKGPHLHEFEQLWVDRLMDGEIVRDGGVVQVIAGATVKSAMKEFDISLMQYAELFGIHGCGRAQTAQEAAKYIRAFVRCRLEVEAAEVIAA